MTVRDLLFASPARSLLLGGGAVIASVAAVSLAPEAALPVEVPALALEAREPVAEAVREVAREDEIEVPAEIDPLASLRAMAAIADPADFAFAVDLRGTTYLRIAEGAGIAVGADRDGIEIDDVDGIAVAIAPISEDRLPEELERWKGRRVLVGGTCAATVIAFAEIARVSGDPRLARDGDEDPVLERWTVKAAFSHGSTMIAAELDGDCEGTWARAADRPAVARAIAIDDRRLEDAARRAFLASRAAAIDAGWREAGQEGAWLDQAALLVRIVEHSTTGARWAYVQARKLGGCGEHDINEVAIYRIAEDGALTAIEAGESPGHIIEELVDLNGDGWFERIVLQQRMLGHSIVGPVGAAELDRIHVPYLGCGC